MSNNGKTQESQALRDAADKLIAAAYEYWKTFQREQATGAVIWLEDSSGKVVIFTRGEYRNQLMSAVDRIGETKYFDVRKDTEDEVPHV